MNPELNPREQQARADYLRHLYLSSGRTNGLYTGLYQQRLAELVAIDREEQALQWKDHDR